LVLCVRSGYRDQLGLAGLGIIAQELSCRQAAPEPKGTVVRAGAHVVQLELNFAIRGRAETLLMVEDVSDVHRLVPQRHRVELRQPGRGLLCRECPSWTKPNARTCGGTGAQPGPAVEKPSRVLVHRTPPEPRVGEPNLENTPLPAAANGVS